MAFRQMQLNCLSNTNTVFLTLFSELFRPLLVNYKVVVYLFEGMTFQIPPHVATSPHATKFMLHLPAFKNIIFHENSIRTRT